MNILTSSELAKQAQEEAMDRVLEKHLLYPGIAIENNNLIYVIGDAFVYSNLWGGVVECFDIRDKKWFIIDKLSNILNINNEKTMFQCVFNLI